MSVSLSRAGSLGARGVHTSIRAHRTCAGHSRLVSGRPILAGRPQHIRQLIGAGPDVVPTHVNVLALHVGKEPETVGNRRSDFPRDSLQVFGTGRSAVTARAKRTTNSPGWPGCLRNHGRRVKRRPHSSKSLGGAWTSLIHSAKNAVHRLDRWLQQNSSRIPLSRMSVTVSSPATSRPGGKRLIKKRIGSHPRPGTPFRLWRPSHLLDIEVDLPLDWLCRGRRCRRRFFRAVRLTVVPVPPVNPGSGRKVRAWVLRGDLH